MLGWRSIGQKTDKKSGFLSKLEHTDEVMASKLRKDPNSDGINIPVCLWLYMQYSNILQFSGGLSPLAPMVATYVANRGSTVEQDFALQGVSKVHNTIFHPQREKSNYHKRMLNCQDRLQMSILMCSVLKVSIGIPFYNPVFPLIH